MVDIQNAETAGYFDKEDYMIKHFLGIEKQRPYPDTIYSLNKDGHEFRFALKGIDTVGKEVLVFKQETCCEYGELSYINAEDCEKNDCEHHDNAPLHLMNSGRNCDDTYDYVSQEHTGPTRGHGTSWCSYESIAGKGLDYVGTRHYLHSCIDGVEYVEECRDYREELCAEETEHIKGLCRVNRWYDCTSQGSQESCEDDSRDCVWADYLWTEAKCHPEVPPGLKFWERESKQICNIATMDKDDYGEDHPMSWGHSSLLYCQRTGDCGNYRNYADMLTEQGYFNKDGEPQPWVYWDDGLISKGDKFVVRGDIIVDISEPTVPTGKSNGDAVCDQWQPPNTGDCTLCEKKLHPCTEYRCRSLGRNCVFDGACKSSRETDSDSPKFTMSTMEPGYNIEQSESTYYENQIEYKISQKVPIHTPFMISFSTDEPTRCVLSMRPPHIARGSVSLPEVVLNDYAYVKEYSINISFPSTELTRLSKYLLFIRCQDIAGNQLSPGVYFSFETYEVDDIREPVVQKQIDDRYYFNEPVNCTAQETLCDLKEEDILYDIRYPLGSFKCIIPETAECKDLSGNSITI